MVRKPTTWSVKGIEEDVRDIARAAADREEQTIGAWIDHAIRVHGGQRPRDDRPDSEPAANVPDALPEPGLAGMGGASADVLLEIVDDELDASSNRLDNALRPMGLALLDLAERMVALERNAQAQPSIGRAPDAERELEPESDYDDDFGPEAPPLPEEEASWPAEAAAPDHGFPLPPIHDLDPGIDSFDMPLVTGEAGAGSDRAREIDRRLRALAGAVDAADTEPPPPTGDLGPTEFDLEPPSRAPAPAEPLELPMAFRGVQKSGYESHPGAAAGEIIRRPVRPRRSIRRKLALSAAAVLILATAGLYVAADHVGLGHVRAGIERDVRPAITTVAIGASHIVETLSAKLDPILNEAKTALFGGDKTEQPEPGSDQTRTKEESPASASSEFAAPEPRSEPEPAPDALSSREEPAPAPGETVPPVVAEVPSPAAEPPTTIAEPAPEPPAPAPVEIAPKPQETRPVPVPEASPAKSVTEVAPPPAPPLPASPGAAASGGRVAALPPNDAGASGSARDELAARAEAGDATAQHDLAISYLTGKNGSKDPARAAELLREAAIQGLPSAQYNLAVLYETGQGVRKDDVRALLWYHSAAEQGHPNAQYNLGVMYAEGRGIPLNFEEAARWFRAAANQGLARALYNLAVMTDEGLGVAQDKAAALDLYRAAAGAGDERAIELLAGSGDVTSEMETPLGGADGVQIVTTTPASLVAEAQGELTRLGLYDGRLDGLMGPKTRTAIRAFQKTAGIPQTGEVSPELLKRLKAATP
ncbi:peptidoglycan-binding protein [Nisaea sediminum]|uniref:peptidoglycan-binding protein n=1 Tax=Nisaea sediminum TaxID=2775867 RepID=UPI001868AB2A|nr:SEL1-like repeat protein [Nisaea sediminum]